MSVLDTVLVTDLQTALIDPSWIDGAWTAAEALDALNQAQDRFLRESGVVIAVGTLGVVPNVVTQALPTGWQQTQRAAWQDASTSATVALGQSDPWEADMMLATWPYDESSPHPVLYSDINVAPAEYQLIPAPLTAGQVLLQYVPQGTTLDGTGVALTVPDDCAPAIKWLALAMLLRKLGRSIDAERAGYCEQRYQDLLEATQVLLTGF